MLNYKVLLVHPLILEFMKTIIYETPF